MKFISGRKNCHLPGLNSYVISERVSPSRGMVRVFHNTGDALPCLVKDGKFVLAPHNHRQDIELTLVCGSVANIDFEFKPKSAAGADYFEWIFRSAIVDGALATQYHLTGDLRISNVVPLSASSPLFLPSSRIHTIVASPGACWRINEGALASPSQGSLCYSTNADFSLSEEGLYTEMRRAELDAVSIPWAA